MVRLIAGIVLGAVAWLVAVFLIGRVAGMTWPEFAAIKDPHLYTVPMLATRLGISALASLVGGFAAALIAGDKARAPLGSGLLLLILFVPYHFTIWNNFPVWYHLTFFVSLPLLGWLGGRLAR